MTINPQLLSAYRFHRAALAAGIAPPPSSNPFKLAAIYESLHKTAPAMMALIHARADVAGGTDRFWSPPFNQRRNGTWKAAKSDMQWIDDPAAIGLRMAAYADEIDRGIDHQGWFTDEDGHGKVRGVVYRLPSRNGVLQFVAGFEDDADAPGAAAIDFGTIYLTERGAPHDELTDCRAAREAARAADKQAEAYAEESRDHDRAYQAGVYWSELGEQIGRAKDEIRSLINVSGMTCRDAFAEFMDEIREAREARNDLARGDYDGERGYLGFWTGDAELRVTFNDGAGQGVLA